MLLMIKANKKLWPDTTILQKILNDRKALGINDVEDKETGEATITIDEEELKSLFKRHFLRFFSRIGVVIV